MWPYCWIASHRLTYCPQAFFCTIENLCKFINRNIRSAICKQIERTRPRFFPVHWQNNPIKVQLSPILSWDPLFPLAKTITQHSSALAECLRLPYEGCSRAQPHVQMSDVTGTWQSKSNQNMRATNRSSCTDHYMSYVFSYFGFCNSALFYLLRMTSDDAVGKSLWKETVFYKSTCIQTPFKKMTNGANMQPTYKRLCLAVKPHPPLPHEPTPRLGGRPSLVSFPNPLALETHFQGQVCWGNWLHPGWLGDPGGRW